MRLAFVTWSDGDRLTHLGEPWYRSSSVAAAFLREVGFAFLIALAITILVERTARAEQLHATKSMLTEVSGHVLHAVLRVRTPDSIVRQIMGSVFASHIVRHDLRLTMALTRMSDEYEKFRDRCVELRINSSYALENVSGNDVESEIKLFIPTPSFPELRGAASVENVSLGGRQLSDREIEEGAGAIEDTDYERKWLWKRSIAPGERLRST